MHEALLLARAEDDDVRFVGGDGLEVGGRQVLEARHGPGARRHFGHHQHAVVEALGVDFDAIAADKPDVVILGTGEQQRFVHPRLVASLSNLRIGVESMDSHAACRTYNILMGEGRKVTLALIIDTDSEGTKAA